jgi:hypothetical protein
MKTSALSVKAFFLIAFLLISHYGLASNSARQYIATADTTWYNIDGKKASKLTLTPDQIAYIQVLDGKQAQSIFGPGYNKGVLYVTSKANKYSDVNTGIQDKIDQSFPPAGSYRTEPRYNGPIRPIVRGMELAERDKWLVLIDNKPSTLEALKAIPIKNITSVTYRGSDMSQAYGPGAKNGVLMIGTIAAPENLFSDPMK